MQNGLTLRCSRLRSRRLVVLQFLSPHLCFAPLLLLSGLWSQGLCVTWQLHCTACCRVLCCGGWWCGVRLCRGCSGLLPYCVRDRLLVSCTHPMLGSWLWQTGCSSEWGDSVYQFSLLLVERSAPAVVAPLVVAFPQVDVVGPWDAVVHLTVRVWPMIMMRFWVWVLSSAAWS